ncbi:MAG: polysaccharide deacetylase family protein, partial [Planctomycetes bacterium]|nr:polysaccharide deacetylase family protein [Planctomycetota bacterium]
MKKALAEKLLFFSGMTAVKWRSLPRALYCFNYHRVGNRTATLYDRDVFSCTGDQFRQHVLLIQERFDLVNLDRLLFLLRHGDADGKPLALLTFDDGYVDNFEIAFPILCELGASAVFFLPTAFIGTRHVPW